MSINHCKGLIKRRKKQAILFSLLFWFLKDYFAVSGIPSVNVTSLAPASFKYKE